MNYTKSENRESFINFSLNSWLLGIMFGIIFYVALKEADKKENSSSEEV